MFKQLLIFFFISCLFSWVAWFPIYGVQLGLLTFRGDNSYYLIGGLGPFVASLICTAIFQGAAGVKYLLASCLRFRPVMYLLIALGLPFLMGFLTNTGGRVPLMDVLGSGLPWGFTDGEIMSLILVLSATLFCWGYGEAGWRGFALLRLQERYSALASATILSVLWFFWHLPLLFCIGDPTLDAYDVLSLMTLLLITSILLTWFYNSTQGSIAICAVFYTGLFAVMATGTVIAIRVGCITMLLALLVTIIFKGKNLSASVRQQSPLFDEEMEHAARHQWLSRLDFLKNVFIDFFLSWFLLIITGGIVFGICYGIVTGLKLKFLFFAIQYPALILICLSSVYLFYRIRRAPVGISPGTLKNQVINCSLVTMAFSMIWANQLSLFVLEMYVIPFMLQGEGRFKVFMILSISPLTMALMKQYHNSVNRKLTVT